MLDRVSKDEYWAREKKEGKGEEEFFEGGEATQVGHAQMCGSAEVYANQPQKKETDPQRIEDQKKVDKTLMANIRKVQDLEAYLGSSFSLRGNERPHEMVF